MSFDEGVVEDGWNLGVWFCLVLIAFFVSVGVWFLVQNYASGVQFVFGWQKIMTTIVLFSWLVVFSMYTHRLNDKRCVFWVRIHHFLVPVVLWVSVGLLVVNAEYFIGASFAKDTTAKESKVYLHLLGWIGHFVWATCCIVYYWLAWKLSKSNKQTKGVRV
jgi:hypothetical protein